MSVDGRVAPGSCTPRPSRPGESHPEALTDPCLSLSAHTARAIHGELALSVTTRRFLPLPVDQNGYDANEPPPSLGGHYSTSSLLRQSAPRWRIGTLGLTVRPLAPSPLTSPTKFSSSARKPRLDSRRLCTGHRRASK